MSSGVYLLNFDDRYRKNANIYSTLAHDLPRMVALIPEQSFKKAILKNTSLT